MHHWTPEQEQPINFVADIAKSHEENPLRIGLCETVLHLLQESFAKHLVRTQACELYRRQTLLHWKMDEGTKTSVSKLPLLSVRASPRDKEAWTARLKEELTALIQYVKLNKEEDKDWFHIECNKTGTRWTGTCWYYYEQIRYEFDLEFEIPVAYPTAAPELMLPQLEGLTSKMYRGGKICQTLHFQPLWVKNSPRFGIAHSLALSLGPWLAAEIPDLVGRGVIEKFKK